MADLTDAQKKRQESRQKRRGSSEEPQQDDNSRDDSSEARNGEPLEAVKQAAKVAAAGAAVGAAAAAARAFTHHGNDADGGTEDERAEPEKPDEPEAESEQDDEPQAEQPEEQQPEAHQHDNARQDDDRQRDEQHHEPEPVEGASLGDAGKAMRTARDQLQELLGKAVESASALERTQNGWVATLEVLELSRIPETTDVLASYELELDEKLGLRSYRQVRRYTRSQANGEGL